MTSLTKVDGEGAPLLAAGMEVGSLHMEVPGADGLGPEPVEESHL